MNEQPAQSAPESRPDTGWFVIVNTAILVAVSIYFRCTQLGTVPGVNGDECWYGNFALDILHGRSTSFLTPNGNPVNPFYILPTLLLHAVAEPSIVLLRLVPLLSGILTLAVLPWVTDRILGRRAAVCTLILLAVLPLPVAYSRFAWDASQIPLATGLLVLASIQAMRSPGTAVVLTTWSLLVASVLIHPTCIFLGLIPYFSRQQFWLDWMGYFLGDKAPRTRKFTAISLILAAVVFGVRVLKFWVRGRPLTPVNLENLSTFFSLLGDLLSGKTIYQYISGARCEEWFWSIQGWALLVLFAWIVVGIYRSKELRDLQTVSTGFLLGLLAYFIVAGPSALRPGFERYGVLLISPMILLASAGVQRMKFATGFKPEYLVIALAYLLLGQFQYFYFHQFRTTAGESHPTFLVSRPDARQQAAELISRHRSDSRPVLVLTPDFHLWQPLKYFLESAPGVIQVSLVGDLDEAREVSRAFQPKGTPLVWIVDFANPAGGRKSFLRDLADELDLQVDIIDDVVDRPALLLAGPAMDEEQASQPEAETPVNGIKSTNSGF